MKENDLSQDEMIKNLLRDYPVDALDFFNPDVIKRYGRPTRVDFQLQESKKHSHYNKNLKNDIAIIYEFKNGKRLVLSLIEHWSDKSKFDIHRFAHYLIDLDFQFPDCEKLPVALFTDVSKKWIKQPQREIRIKCLDEVFLTFRYRLIRMKDYDADKYIMTKNRFIAVLRSAMRWDLENKIMLAIDLINHYKLVEEDIKIVVKNIEIIEYYLHINRYERDNIIRILKGRGDKYMSIVKELLKEGKIEGKIEGIYEGKIETAKKMHEKGFSAEEILDITGLTREDLVSEGILQEK